MATVHDAAAYILSRTSGGVSAMKLQKLLYYSQAWSLVWDEARLFPEPIEAWANGPVVRAVYDRHRGKFWVETWEWGDAKKLSAEQRETIDAVLEAYGKKSAHWLSALTHRERPWKDARAGLRPGDRGDRKITRAAMAEYYGGLA